MQNQISPLVLAKGSWAAYPCDDRMLRIYLLSLILFGFIFAVVFFLVYRPSRARGQPTPEFGSLDRTAKIALTTVGMLMLISLALVPALARSRTLLSATETSIVETGCQFRTAYEERYDREKLQIIYRFARGKSNFDELYFIQKGKRRIRLRINKSSHLKNLALIAPEAMKAYVDRLKSEGKQIPYELIHL